MLYDLFLTIEIIAVHLSEVFRKADREQSRKTQPNHIYLTQLEREQRNYTNWSSYD